MYIYKPTFDQLTVTFEKVYIEMGYRKTQPEEPVMELTDRLLNEISDIAAPVCFFEIYEGKIEDVSIILNETVLQVNDVLSELMSGSEQFAVFAATAGLEFQCFHDKLKAEGDLLEIFVADAIGSCMAESAGDFLEKMLEKQTGVLRHTNRFSPGYCGWHLSEQKKLFHLFGDNTCGITLSDSCLMKPIKSISGIIGIGKKVKEKTYGCKYCTMKDCYKAALQK